MNKKLKRPRSRKDIPSYIQQKYGVDIEFLIEHDHSSRWSILEEKLDPLRKIVDPQEFDTEDYYSTANYPSAKERYQQLVLDKMEKEIDDCENLLVDEFGIPQYNKEIEYHRLKAKYHKVLEKLKKDEDDPFPKKRGAPEELLTNYWIEELISIVCEPDYSKNTTDFGCPCKPVFYDIGLALVYFECIQTSYLKRENSKKLDQFVRQAAKRLGLY